MAIVPSVLYPTKTSAPDAAYPQGGPRDITLPGDGTGTPWTAAVLGDFWGWIQGLFSKAAVTPTGNSDTALASDIFNSAAALHGISLAKTTDALVFDLAGVPAFVTRAYNVDGDGGMALWVATGNTVGGSAGTILWTVGALYDRNGVEFAYASPEITFEAFDHQYQDAVDFQATCGRPIVLQAAGLYNLGGGAGIGLELGTGATIKGPALGAAGVSTLARFVYTGTGQAISVSGGAAPREDVLLENFMIDAGTDGIALEFVNCQHCMARGLQANGGHATGAVYVNGGLGNILQDIRVGKTGGINNPGVYVFASADQTAIIRPYFVNPLNQNWASLSIHSTAINTKVQGVAYYGTSPAAPISDSGAGTVFLDGFWHKSPHFDLAGASQLGGSDCHRGGYINRLKVVYVGGSAAGATPASLEVGKTIGGVFNLTYFLNTTSTAGKDMETDDINPAAFSNNQLANGETVTFRTGGGSEGGECELMLEILPYRGRV